MNFLRCIAALDSVLRIRDYDAVDSALNGIQVGIEKPSEGVVKQFVSAVDASLETIRRAVQMNADCLFVHHGIFWKSHGTFDSALIGNHHARIKLLLDHGCALYAAHLPLDVHATLGNNIAIAERLGLREITPFGHYKGVDIGYCGTMTSPRSVEEIQQILLQDNSAQPLSVLPFGPERCRRIGIVSGGGAFALAEAISRNLELLITGDANHTMYYAAQENGIHVLSAGHYNTEIWGVQRVADYVAKRLKIPSKFIDLPTGL